MPINKSTDGSIADAVAEAIDAKLRNTNTAVPASIVSFDASTQTATVQIGIKRSLNGVISDIAPLEDVPVIFPRGGGYVITFPISTGDECQLIFNQRSIDVWLTDGGTVDPQELRKHDISDAVAYVGMSSDPNVISGFNESQLELRSTDGTASFIIDKAGKFALNGANEELIGLLSELIDEISKITDTSDAGVSAINNKAKFIALKTRLDTLLL